MMDMVPWLRPVLFSKTIMLLDALREKRAEILQIAANHGAFNVRVFGSVVRGRPPGNTIMVLLSDVRRKKPCG